MQSLTVLGTSADRSHCEAQFASKCKLSARPGCALCTPMQRPIQSCTQLGTVLSLHLSIQIRLQCTCWLATDATDMSLIVLIEGI